MIPLLFLALAQAPQPADVKMLDLKDGYVKVTTPSYSVEIPKGWAVGRETPWGDRKFGGGNSGQLGVMTAGRTQSSWDELYRVSLYFIMREEKGTATPYELGKTDSGMQTMSFSVKNEAGFTNRRYVLVKNKEGLAAALSVRITKEEDEKTMRRHFDRMVKSVTLLD